jgi:hypothetical protein
MQWNGYAPASLEVDIASEPIIILVARIKQKMRVQKIVL